MKDKLMKDVGAFYYKGTIAQDDCNDTLEYALHVHLTWTLPHVMNLYSQTDTRGWTVSWHQNHDADARAWFDSQVRTAIDEAFAEREARRHVRNGQLTNNVERYV